MNKLSNLLQSIYGLMSLIPDSLIAFVGRFSVAAIFWQSGQTKVEGFAIDLISGKFQLGWPKLADSAIYLFENDYKVPLLPPEIAAPMAAFNEHLFPILLLFGIATRFSACGLLGMTLVIQLFVYPGAYPTHGVWIAALLFIIAKGGGVFSIDHLIKKYYAGK